MSLNKENIELKLKGEYSSEEKNQKVRTFSKGSFSYKRSSLHGIKEVSVKDQDVRMSESQHEGEMDERQGTWVNAAQWMIADIIGAGVLSISGGLVELGWVLGLLFLVVMLPLNLYTSILLSRIRTLHPECITMMDMANTCIGPRMMKFTAFCVYTNLTLMLGDYILLCGDVLGFGFYTWYLCKMYWAIIACVLLTPLCQFRSLVDIGWLCWVNMATIIVSLYIAIIYLLSQGRANTIGESGTEAVAATLSFWTFFGGLSKFMFAYTGQFMYLEIMAEMKEPEDFPKTFYIVSPFQIFVYFSTGIIGYYYLGENAAGDIIQQAIPFSPLLRVAAFILLIHMLITYLIKGTVMARAIHLVWDEKTACERTPKSKQQWFVVTTGLLGVCYILANLIPFFDQLTGLIGALVQPFTAMIIPISMYLYAQKSHGFKIPAWEYCVMAICIVLSVLLFVVGTIQNFSVIIEDWSKYGPPFSCICENIWNTCACSAEHIGMEDICSEN